MGRSRCLALVSLLLLVCLSPGGAASPHGDVREEQVAIFGGRRGLLQATPGSPPSTTPPTPTTAPPTPGTTPPPTPGTTPPTPATTPPTPATTPPTPGTTPPTPGTTPPTPGTPTTPGSAPGASPKIPGIAPGFVPGVLPSPPPFAPAPAPMGVTSRQKLNAIIAGSVVAGVVGIALVFLFCRCPCLRRQKKLPFQRLQMT